MAIIKSNDFEASIAGWNPINGAVLTLDTGSVIHGVGSFKIVTPGVVAAEGARLGPFGVVPGSDLTLDLWCLSNVPDPGIQMVFNFQPIAGDPVGFVSIGFGPTLAHFNESGGPFIITVPVGVTSGYVDITTHPVLDPQAGTVFIDDFLLEGTLPEALGGYKINLMTGLSI